MKKACSLLIMLVLLLAACAEESHRELVQRTDTQATADAIVHSAQGTATAITAFLPATIQRASPAPSLTAIPAPASATGTTRKPTREPGQTADNTPAPTGTPSAPPKASPTSTEAPVATPEPTPASTPDLTPIPTDPPQAGPTEPEVGTVTLYIDGAAQGSAGVDLREEPGAQSPVILSIPSGVTVQADTEPVEGVDGQDWFRVAYGDRTGYVQASFLSLNKPEPTALVSPSPTAQPTGGAPTATQQPAVAATEPAPATAYIPDFFAVNPSAEQVTKARMDGLLPGARQTQHFTIHYLPGSFGEREVEAFARDLEEGIAHSERTLGVDWEGGQSYYLSPAIFPPPKPGVRGHASQRTQSVYQLFDGSGTRLERQYLATHEVTHQITAATIGGSATTMLSEGIAMHISEPYLLEDRNVSLDGFARAALNEGKLIPITSLSSGEVGFRGRLFYRYPYDEAGSFVGFLIRTYGMDKFKRVYTSNAYTDVYGKGLSTLESEWKEYLRSNQAVGPFATDEGRYLKSIADVQAGYKKLFATMSGGERIPATCYAALDGARIAADRGDFAAVDSGLAEFYRTLPPNR